VTGTRRISRTGVICRISGWGLKIRYNDISDVIQILSIMTENNRSNINLEIYVSTSRNLDLSKSFNRITGCLVKQSIAGSEKLADWSAP
jgi:hypothetical protein